MKLLEGNKFLFKDNGDRVVCGLRPQTLSLNSSGRDKRKTDQLCIRILSFCSRRRVYQNKMYALPSLLGRANAKKFAHRILISTSKKGPGLCELCYQRYNKIVREG